MKSIIKFVAVVLSFIGRSYFVGFVHEGDLVVEERVFGQVRYAWRNRVAGTFPASTVFWTPEALDWLQEFAAYVANPENALAKEALAMEARFPHTGFRGFYDLYVEGIFCVESKWNTGWDIEPVPEDEEEALWASSWPDILEASSEDPRVLVAIWL